MQILTNKFKKIFRILKFWFKKKIKIIKVYFSLPHVWMLIIIMVLSVLFLLLSLVEKDEFLSSMYANIFSGLLTGVILSLISWIKSVSLYRTHCIINWLENIHKECLKFINESRKVYIANKKQNLSEQEQFDEVYNLLCLGNSINESISQGQYNETFPFDTYKYCKKKLRFDSIKEQTENIKIKEKIQTINISTISKKELKTLFKDMDNSIFTLNKKILDKITELKIKNKVINLT